MEFWERKAPPKSVTVVGKEGIREKTKLTEITQKEHTRKIESYQTKTSLSYYNEKLGRGKRKISRPSK